MWQNIVSLHLQAYKLMKDRQHRQAYDAQSQLLTTFQKYYAADKTRNYPVPLFTVIITDLRLIAKWADEGIAKAGGERSLLNAASNQIRACTPVRADRPALLWTMLPIVNQLFKIYFYVRSTSQRQNSTIEAHTTFSS